MDENIEQPKLFEQSLVVSPNYNNKIVITITGSRSITDWVYVYSCMNDFRQNHLPDDANVVLRSGHARGVDVLVENWAKNFDIPVEIYLPNWNKHGKKAGLLRNSEMLKGSSGTVAIWDGQSTGTLDCINKTKQLGLYLKVYQQIRT